MLKASSASLLTLASSGVLFADRYKGQLYWVVVWVKYHVITFASLIIHSMSTFTIIYRLLVLLIRVEKEVVSKNDGANK